MTEGRVEGLPIEGDLLADKYRVERLIGVGGMGAVLAAKHIDLDERVAIKMLLPHIPTHGEPVARFLREAQAAAKIRSDHVVRIYDVGRLDSGAPFIVMEYLEGSDLAQTTDARGPLPIEDAVGYVLQACEAIASAHALGIVHRDLKPANLFLTTMPDGSARVKVLDFGISKVSRGDVSSSMGLTSTTSIMGTPAFRSPEQLRATRDVDARADVWALGAILYALLTGSPPYDGASNADVSAKIIRDEPPPLATTRPDAPPELAAAIRSCLEKDPEKRCPTVAALVAAIAPFAGEAGQATASRVTRVAAGVAPTLKSSAPRELRQPDGPTRTASAWGETGSESRARSRSRAPIVVALMAIAAIVVFGAIKLTSPTTSAGASSTTSPSSAATTAPTPSPSPSTAASTAASPSTSTSTATPTIATMPSATESAPRPHASAIPIARPTAAPKPSSGLFDNRE
jgi:serine/threonine-protein kinase